MSVYLRAKFQVPSLTVTSFRKGVILSPLSLPPSTLKRTLQNPTQIRVNESLNLSVETL